MKIVRPLAIADAQLTASNIAENEYPAWDGVTSFAQSAYVLVLGTNIHRVYQSLVAGNSGNTPKPPLASGINFVTDPTDTKWLYVGLDNRWKMFDTSITSQAANANTIDVTLATSGRNDTVGLLNVSAASARVIQSTPTDGTVYDTTRSLVSPSGVQDWYAYFFEPVVRLPDMIFSDLLPYANANIEVILTDSGQTVLCGGCILGQSLNIGGTEYGADVGIQDYSIKSQDAFGNYTITQRAFNKRGKFNVEVASTLVDTVQNLLASYRAEPILYIGNDDYAATFIYGFFKDFDIVISYPTVSICSIELEGLT